MLAPVLFAALLARPTDLVFVRHGETVANATGRYTARTIDTFSTRGSAGVADLTRRLLAGPGFDRILVSPSPRALRTVAPYLRATRQRAVVWPLLYECCTQRRPAHAAPTQFSYGTRIRIPLDLTALFIVEPGHDRYPDSPDYDSGLAQVAAAVADFNARFEGGRILVVGHSGQGGQFLHSLTGKWIRLANTREVRLALGWRAGRPIPGRNGR